jgi:hypothetical protein
MSLPPPRVVLVLVAALLASGLATLAVRGSSDDSGKVASRAATTSSSSTTASSTTAGAPSSSAAPATTTPVPPAEAAVLAQIKDQVAQVRELPWLGPLDIQVAGDADFVRQLNAVVTRDQHLDRMNGDSETLKVLKLIPNNTDYTKVYNDLLGAAVLGFYDPKTKKLLVRTSGTLTPEQRITVAHEMDHALTDQHFQFGPATDVLDRTDKQEQYTAFSGLLEGDAKLLEALWAQKYLTAKERQQASGETGGDTSAVLKRTPPSILDSLYWPYTSGRAFVIGRWRTGGWAAVNAVYGRPPDSTQVVNHPELYNAGKTWAAPVIPDVAAATGCAPVRTGSAGEFTMTELLQLYLTAGTATNATAGWNGDSFSTVRCGSARGFVDRWVSNNNSAAALAAALGEWSQRWSGSFNPPGPDGRFSGSGGSGRIVQAGPRVDLILGDDPATVTKLSAALSD